MDNIDEMIQMAIWMEKHREITKIAIDHYVKMVLRFKDNKEVIDAINDALSDMKAKLEE